MAAPTANEIDPNERVVIVSCDTHIGPRLREDLRAVLPEGVPRRLRRLHDVRRGERQPDAVVDALNATEGHYDPYRADRDLDARTAPRPRCIFHGSQNGAAGAVHHLRPVARRG